MSRFRVLVLSLFVMGCEPERADDLADSPNVQTKELKSRNGRVVMTQAYYVDKSRNEVSHGETTYWFESGARRLEVTYRHGKRHGQLTEWAPSGEKVRQGRFAEDKETGVWTWWHVTGEKSAECTFKDGKIFGEKTYWNDRGKMIKEEVYEKSGQLAEMTTWYDSGQKHSSGTFKVQDVKETDAESLSDEPRKHGRWQYWTRKGDVLADGTWKEGKPWEGICAVPAAGDAGSQGGIEVLGRYSEGKLIQRIHIPPD